ncbi:MAG: hypothetical protein K6E33_02810 [Lachnospiraceae bacterium]|nr:hypothetical protein [Lachnospiraceae bacterium]
MEKEETINGETPLLDPDLERFLDESSARKKLTILSGMREKLDDRMIDTMAAALDLDVKKGDIDERYRDLASCLDMLSRFETDRMR